MNHLLNETEDRLGAWLAERGYPRYRVRQIGQWLWQQRVDSPADMTDLPLALRHDLAEHFGIWRGTLVGHRSSADGTEKLVLEFPGGSSIECVLLRDGTRRTICISSQVGCAMGCVFCASGLDGVERNLTCGEIVEQVLRLQRLLPLDERLSHVVVMGMGEPLANLDRLLPALQRISHSTGLGISARRITISTVGLPPAIDRLADSGHAYRLAVSLHAADDELRNQLVPVNARIGLASIMAAVDRYLERTGQRVTCEYVLLAGVNDGPGHARRLAALLRRRRVLLNLIPYNPVPGLPYETPAPRTTRQFREVLEQAGIRVQVRERKGDAIAAACGQLRRVVAAPGSPAELPSATGVP